MPDAARNVTEKLVAGALVDGTFEPGGEIGLRADQVLLQDVLGTLVMLELEAMDVDRVAVEVAVQYVDHNLLEVDNLNQEEHLFLRSACRRFGVWYCRPGTGISHPSHMQRFGRPGAVLVGCDSHTSAAGSLGMLAVGMGGLDVAAAMSGEPFYLAAPQVWGVELTGELPDWVSAKDVVLEMLRRHGVEGAFGRIIEYHGPGLAGLSAMDRHVIANMGAEMGATTTVFPSDGRTRQFLDAAGRGQDWTEITADAGADYHHHDAIDLSSLEPLIATPSSPGNVERVRDVSGVEVYQAYIGSSANPGYRDFAVVAEMVRGRLAHDRVSFDINPSTHQIYRQLVASGHLAALLEAGARVHQPGCNGCIGMGQAPARDRPSLRTVPRNFPGRSGTKEDSVYLCSPETAAAAALTGRITDPRDLGLPVPSLTEPDAVDDNPLMLVAPVEPAEAMATKLAKTDNIVSLPDLDPVVDPDDGTLEVVVLLAVGDDVSTDTITPAGAQVLPHWANLPKTAGFTFRDVDSGYPDRAMQLQDEGRLHAIVGGQNYGQGSSRENAALAPRSLGLGLVLARSFARIHWQNLVNAGVLPVTWADPDDADRLAVDATLRIENVLDALAAGSEIEATVGGDGSPLRLRHDLSDRQIDLIRVGGLINHRKRAED